MADSKSETKMSVTDHAVAIGKAGLNAVPMVGGSIASLIESYVPSAMERSMGRGLKMLQERLDAFDQRIDYEAVNKDDFAELYNSSRLLFARTTREEKIRGAANVLANLFLKAGDSAKASYEELDHFIRCLDSLSIGAIAMLQKISKLVPQEAGKFSTVHGNEVVAAFPDWEPSFSMGLVAELRAFHLVRVQEPAIRVGHNELIELTPLGRRLLDKFILPQG